MRLLASFVRARAIMIPQSLAQAIVAGGAAELLDVLVLVERGNALRRQLSADPVRFLDEMDMTSAPGGGERGGNSAGAASDHEHVARDVTRVAKIRHAHDGDGRIAVHRHPHDVDEGVERTVHLSSRHGARQPERDLREGHDQRQDDDL